MEQRVKEIKENSELHLIDMAKLQSYDINAKSFNVIVSFDSDQIMFDMEYNPENEIDFINHIFDLLKTETISGIYKISCCCDKPKWKWFNKRNGKWYFNPNINDDKDTHFWFNRKCAYFINRLESN